MPTKIPFFGEPGRIYRISKKMGILVCAKDKCLWLNDIVDYKTEKNCMEIFQRYEKLITINDTIKNKYAN